MRAELSDIVHAARRWVHLEPDDVVLDIGCNDGTLLENYLPARVVRVGIDPAANLAQEAREHCELHAQAYFDADTFLGLTGGRTARIITSVAMFYDLDDPHTFVSGVERCLSDDGVWVLQLSYTPLMLEQNAFDNICHEHVAYYTLRSLQDVIRTHGLQVVDAELNEANGGSFRLTVTKQGARCPEVPRFRHELGRYRRDSLLEFEERRGYNEVEGYLRFRSRIERLRGETLDLLEQLRRRGATVFGYGASTKGNTLLQYYGITPDHLAGIAERQPEKYGKFTVGSWIPILSEQTVRDAKPDYLFILPWHFTSAFLEREAEFRMGGGRFIVPLPTLQVI